MTGQPIEEPHPDTIGIPDDWLEAFVVLIGDGYEGDEDGRFAAEIEAIHRMRDIERREGRTITLSSEVARAELVRRRDPDGSKRRAAEAQKLAAKRAAEIDRLVTDRAMAERFIVTDPQYAALLRKRIEGIDARLTEMGVQEHR